MLSVQTNRQHVGAAQQPEHYYGVPFAIISEPTTEANAHLNSGE